MMSVGLLRAVVPLRAIQDKTRSVWVTARNVASADNGMERADAVRRVSDSPEIHAQPVPRSSHADGGRCIMRQGEGVLRLRGRPRSSGSSRYLFGDIASERWLLRAVSS